MKKEELPKQAIEIRANLQDNLETETQKLIRKNPAYYPNMMVYGSGEENLIKNEIERLRLIGEYFEGMWVVLDNEGFPMWPTVSLDEETTIQRMVKLGPNKPWKYYLDKGHTVEKVTINVKKERP